MRIQSGAGLLAATIAGVSLFFVYVFVVATSLDLIAGYFAQGCSAKGSGALQVGELGTPLCFEFWLNRYQALIGGLLALGGAFLAFSAVRQQIAQTERHAEEKRERDSNAARSVVTHALSKINSYSADCVSVLRKHKPKTGMPLTSSVIVPPIFPFETIPVLQEAVRYSSPEHASRFADLIARSQIQMARLTHLVEKSSQPPTGVGFFELQNNIVDAMDLHVRSANLFDYGRNFLNSKLVTSQQMRETFRLLNLDTEEWPVIQMRLDAHEGSERSESGTV